MSGDEDRVETLHPEGKQGVRIERLKYEEMKRALLKVVPLREAGVPFRDLRGLVDAHLDAGVFQPEVSRAWYVTVVKQDLEARGRIEQVPGVRPQHLRRVRRPR